MQGVAEAGMRRRRRQALVVAGVVAIAVWGVCFRLEVL